MARNRKTSLVSLAPSNVTTQASLYTDAASEIASSSASLHTIRGAHPEPDHDDSVSVFTDANDFTRSHSSLALDPRPVTVIASAPSPPQPRPTPAAPEMSNIHNQQQISATEPNPSSFTIRPAAASVTPLPLTTALPHAGNASMIDSQTPKLSPSSHDEKLPSASPSELSTRDEKMSEKHDSSKSTSDEDPDLKGLSPEQKRIIMEQVQEVKNTVTFKQLWRFSTKLELFYNAIGIVGAVVAGAANPLQTVIFGNLTTAFTDFGREQFNAASTGDFSQVDIARERLFTEVDKDVLYLVYIGIAMFVATYAYMAAFIYTGEKNTRRIREKYLQSVLKQNIGYFDSLGSGEFVTRITTDTHLIQEGISDKIPITVMFLATFVTGFVVAFIRNWRLALVVSTIVPVIMMTGAGMNHYITRYRESMLLLTSQAGTLAEEVISSIRNTHAFGTQKKLAAMYDKPNLEAMQLGIKSSVANGIGMGGFFFVIYAAYALAFYYGTTLILQGRATSGEVVNVFFAILIGAFSLAQIAPNIQATAFAIGAANSIFNQIDRIPSIDSSSTTGLQPTHLDGTISFENVDFIYPSRPSVQVLYNFSATFEKGKNTALVGSSGSGKSTIIALIERFYDPVGGKIRLDGHEITDLNLKWLRSQIGLVSQEPTLFSDTVANNIAMGLIGTRFENDTPQEKFARIVEASKKANSHGFITSLPLGYDCMIGERAILLSGGQKQRIAIARAIVGDPQILLLDEASSALDTASELLVQNALDVASIGRTTITIAHRLSTIKNADQIIVMTGGRIVERASGDASDSAHNHLLLREGAYASLVNAQRFRTEQERSYATPEEGAGQPASIDALAQEKAQDFATNEKPAFGTLNRTRTGRSVASEILENRQHDLESGDGRKPPTFIYLFKRMLQLNSKQKLDYIIGTLAAVVIGCVYPVFGIIFGGVLGVFSTATGDELRSGGNRYALYCFIVAIIASLCVALQSYHFASSAERLSRIIRVRVFSAIMRQDIAYFDADENSTGKLTAQVSDLAQKILGLFGLTLGVIIQSVFTLFAGALIGLIYAPRVAAVGVACLPFSVGAGLVRLKVVVLKDVQNKKSHAQSAQMACEAASAIRTVQSLTRENQCMEVYAASLDEPERRSNRTALVANAYYSLSQALTFFVIALIFWWGSQNLANGQIDTNQFFVAMISVVFASIQAGQVFTYVPDMSSARGAAATVVELLDAVPEIDYDDPSGLQLAETTGQISFDDVHFRYPTRPHVRVLRGLDLEVKAGQFVAIVGPSGCGKSTLIQLIEKFYNPLSGTIKIDGLDIAKLNIASYRQHISLVSQEPTLYQGSVKFNITLGATRPVTQEDVEQACRDANIHDFVMSLPDGYDTNVGGKGSQLSGGQRQRIAIARSLIRNPKILLLDEATSALDSESERVVQKALDNAIVGRTRSVVSVAHRLSTIQGADVIYVLQDGRIAEAGQHFDLLARKGIYYELVNQQNLDESHK